MTKTKIIIKLENDRDEVVMSFDELRKIIDYDKFEIEIHIPYSHELHKLLTIKDLSNL